MKFWLDKGIDGFRMDVIPFISKEQTFPDYPKEYETHPEHIYASGPKLHDYLQEMNREVLSKYDVMTVGEALGVTLEQTPLLVDERRHELNMIFHFDAVRLNRNGWRWKPWTLPELKAIYARFDRELDVNCWQTVFLSNHDNPRLVSSFGDDSALYRVPSAKVLATMLLTFKGTPFIYQGDELGMTNYPFTEIEQFDDIEVRNAWNSRSVNQPGRTPRNTFSICGKPVATTVARRCNGMIRPMRGFTTAAKPWLAVHPNFKEINARQEVADPKSVYHYFKQVIELRKKTPAFVYGDYAGS